MATPDNVASKRVKAAVQAYEKAAGKPAGAGALKASGKDAKGRKPAALPDATLTDDELDASEAPGAASGLAAWLLAGPRRWIVLGAGALALIVIAAASVVATSYLKAPVEDAPSDVIAGPAQAIDGGTVIVAGQTLQLEDIDAPPASLMCRDGAYQYRCGDDARRALSTAIGDGPIECVHAHPQRGGRLAARCRNETGLDIAAIQVESGWAVNDLRRSSRYVAEELRARNNANGLWRNDFAHPELWSGVAAARR